MQSTLYQLELDQRKIDCGMSYVFQLGNGSFFIIDGGYFTEGEEDRLYAFLCGLSDGMPKIAGWFFSHAHQDHIGNFINFIRKYAEKVQIDALLYNFQPCDFSALDPESDWRSSDPRTFQTFYQAIDACLADVPRVSLHTGDCLALGELTLEVLYTHEDMARCPDAAGKAPTFNDHSTVIRITIQGQRILFSGDIYTTAERILLNDPEALRCDILQVSHHGYDGPTEAFYRETHATVALWPTPSDAFEAISHNHRHPSDDYLLHESSVQEHLVSGHGAVALPLPYQLGTFIRHEPLHF